VKTVMKPWIPAILLSAALAFAQAPKAAVPPDDFSGMYTFLQEGEFVQINVEEGSRLTGFISRYSDGEKSNFLDHFFDKAQIKGSDLQFTTKKVHGVWFDFKGSASRGPGKTRNEEGYYVIKGTLTQYTSDANQAVTAKQREITFRSFPQDMGDDTPKTKH
jgi:hypothetical protein